MHVEPSMKATSTRYGMHINIPLPVRMEVNERAWKLGALRFAFFCLARVNFLFAFEGNTTPFTTLMT